jgi:hypothetical protein
VPNAVFYSNVAQQTTLSGSISSGSTAANVGATTGFPGSFPYILALDYGAATEELVSVTAAAGTTLTVTRGYGGTSAQSHSLGAVVRHVYNAQDATDFRTHEASTGAVHGLTGNIVGTSDVQSLSNKTLTSPTINAGALSGTFTGTPTFSGAVVLSGTPSISSGAALAGTFSGTPTFSGNVTNNGEIGLNNLLRGTRALSTDSQYESRVTGDANARWFVRTDGRLAWGPGTTSFDTVLYRSGVGTLTTDTALTVGGNATVTGSLTVSGIGGQLHARKTSDTNVASNTTLSTDPHLTVAVATSSVYEIEGVLFVTSASVTPDINLTVNAPAGSSGFWNSTAVSFNSTADPDTVRTIASAIGASRAYGVSVAGSTFGIPIFGMVEVAGTSGNVTIDWAQSTSNATATTLKIYSWIRLTKVA